MAVISRAIIVSMALTALFFLAVVEGRDYLVGGKAGAWKVPSSSSEADALNKWSQISRFLIGDTLVWKYDPKNDSVLQVTREAYQSCNTTSPIGEYKDGQTQIKLDRSGPFYFISGAPGNCDKGEKLLVVVISPRTKSTGGASSSSMVPSPVPSPASAPSSSQTINDGSAVAPSPTSGVTARRCPAIVLSFGVLVGFFGLL